MSGPAGAPLRTRPEAYCWSFGGIRGGSSGVNDTPSPSRGAATNPPPVEGSPPDRAELDTPYGPDPNDRRKFTTRVITARRARLSYEVVERLRGAALLRVKLETGRTHQIRVQLAESGFPVIGDDTYGVPGGSRLMLHAERLKFPHAGSTVECAAPLPEELRAALVQRR